MSRRPEVGSSRVPRSAGNAGRLSRAVRLVAWVATMGLAGALAWRRVATVGETPQGDLRWFFLPAAREVARGHSPYDIQGYVYSPLVATLLAPIRNASWVGVAWTAFLVVSGLLGCFLGVRACIRSSSPLHFPALLALAVVTLFYNWRTTSGLWFGQVDMLVLLGMTGAMAAHRAGHKSWAGVALGFGGLVKTWPAALLVWLLRRPRSWRLQGWLGACVPAALAAVLALVVGGVPAIGDMVKVAFAYSNQHLVAYSVWGAGRYLFSGQPSALPLVVSPWIQATFCLVLAAVVLALAVVLLRRPGDPVIALPNLMFVLLLLLPVSHHTYLILPLPALWCWVARAVAQPREVRTLVPAAVLFLWWLVVMRMNPSNVGSPVAVQQAQYVAVFAATIAAAATSILAARALQPDSEDA